LTVAARVVLVRRFETRLGCGCVSSFLSAAFPCSGKSIALDRPKIPAKCLRELKSFGNNGELQ